MLHCSKDVAAVLKVGAERTPAWLDVVSIQVRRGSSFRGRFKAPANTPPRNATGSCSSCFSTYSPWSRWCGGAERGNQTDASRVMKWLGRPHGNKHAWHDRDGPS
jgi:hypothetical protein